MSPVRRTPRVLTRIESTSRTTYLREVAGALWPHPLTTSIGPDIAAPGRLVREFIVVPNARKPRLLLPAQSPRAAATAVRRYSEPRSRLARFRLELLALSMRTGAGGSLLRDRLHVRAEHGDDEDSIESYLSSALGQEVLVSLHVGPARANRKPVLALLSPKGELVGFAKIGINELTRRLVLAEAASLTALASFPFQYTSIPGLLHAGKWAGLEVLVQSALPVWQSRAPLDGHRLSESMLEIAHVSGVSTDRFSSSPYRQALSARLEGLQASEDVRCLQEAAQAVFERAAAAMLPMGAWHGDWTPWNMASLADTILLWDWERFSAPAPLGFDAVHHRLQAALVHEREEPRAAVAGCVTGAPTLLAPFGLDPASAELTALLYLIDLAARYLHDGQAEAGARLGVLRQWLLPELAARTAAL